MDKTTKELKILLQKQLEENIYHLAPAQEEQFYQRIAQGDLTLLEEHQDATPFEGMGVLSSNSLRNAKYHLIVLIAMITRRCIEHGLPMEEAYTLSDLFIRRLDVMEDMDNLSILKNEVIAAFVRQMHERPLDQVTSLPVRKAIEYIDRHLTEPLSPAKVAGEIGFHPDYLSRLFREETQISLGQYIQKRKCRTACYMLRNSNASCTDIAVFLGYSSCSHFIERFKQFEGMTPNEYRKGEI